MHKRGNDQLIFMIPLIACKYLFSIFHMFSKEKLSILVKNKDTFVSFHSVGRHDGSENFDCLKFAKETNTWK